MGNVRALALCVSGLASSCAASPPEGPEGSVVVKEFRGTVQVDTATDTIYWTENGRFRSEPATSASLPAVEAGERWCILEGAVYLLGDDLRVWENGAERTIATGLTGTSGARRETRAFAVDAEAAFVGLQTPSLSSVSVLRVSLATGEGLTLADERPLFDDLAQDAERLFWVEDPFEATQIEKSGASAGAVTRLLDETALAELFPGERTPQPANIASDSGALYVTVNNQNGASIGGVLKLEKSTGLISVLAFDDLHPLAIALDDQHVYYTRNHDTRGAVVRVPKEGGPPEIVAARQLRPIHVFLTSTRVYWINRHGPELDPPEKSAELRSIAKP